MFSAFVNGCCKAGSPCENTSIRDGVNTVAVVVRVHAKLSAAEKRQLFGGDCQVVTSISALPQPIKNAFATVTQDKPFALANPGTRFNATDVLEPGLPQRRLLFAGVCSNRWIIQYEKGGWIGSVEVIVFSIESKSDVHFMWGGLGFTPAVNLTALRDAGVSGEFRDADRFLRVPAVSPLVVAMLEKRTEIARVSMPEGLASR
jgi:hypothetical protein